MIWALIYYGATLGGPHSATLGMRVMDLELRTWYGAPGYFVLGACHGADIPFTFGNFVDGWGEFVAVDDAARELGAPLNIVHRDISPQNLVISFEGVLEGEDCDGCEPHE